jgi:hypothetical protein
MDSYKDTKTDRDTVKERNAEKRRDTYNESVSREREGYRQIEGQTKSVRKNSDTKTRMKRKE